MTIWKMAHPSGAEIWGWQHDAVRLKGAPYQQSSMRPHVAFVPPHAKSENLPVIYYLPSWLSAGRAAFQWEAFREDLASRLMRLIQNGLMKPCVVVAPDLYTDYGGSQFIDSEWVGPHASYVVHELIPWVEKNLPVLKGVEHRGVFGRSSGGFGALRFAMDFPQTFSAVACHSGDMGFEWSVRRSIIDLCTGLVKFNHPLEYLSWASQQKKLSGWDTHLLMLLGSCAFYSPNPAEPWGFDLPIDLKSAEIIESVYEKWMAHDPVVRAAKMESLAALDSLKMLFIDCGNRDQYYLHFGSRMLSRVLREAGVKHTYQEFDDNHSGTSYRFDESLPRLAQALYTV